MRVLVIGAGSIGQRHCRNLAVLGHEVLVWDPDPNRLREVGAVRGAKAVSSLAEGLGVRPDGALICTPPASHLQLASQALSAGAHVFVEKPVSHTSDGVLELVDAARRRERVLMVGFNLRFLPSLRRLRALLEEKRVGQVFAVRAEFGAYLPDWRPGRDYRENYAVRADLGGGILLDASHELDCLGWLFGEALELCCAAGHWSGLAGDTEDLAEVMVRFQSGVLAQLHVDYLQHVYRRNLQIIGAGGVILWDYPTHAVTVQAPDGGGAPEDLRAADGDANAMYLAEMRHFACCVAGQESPLVDGWEALRSLRMVEAAKRSARERRWVGC